MKAFENKIFYLNMQKEQELVNTVRNSSAFLEMTADYNKNNENDTGKNFIRFLKKASSTVKLSES